MNNSEAFTYWKKPWHKWVLLVGAALQIIEVWREVEKLMIIYQQKTTLFAHLHGTAMQEVNSLNLL